MDVETRYLATDGGAYWDAEDDQRRICEAMEARQSELEAEGHKVLIVPTGGAHPLGFAAHALTFKEMIEQSEAAGDRLDWIFHTAGTGTALPGLIAAKLLIDHPVRFLRRQRAGNH